MGRLNLVRDRTVHYDASALYPAAERITYTRDKWGLRGTFANPSEISILTIGGSATDQRFIDDNATWQAVIQRSFAEEGKRVVVANAGVDGQSTFGHIKNFDWWFPFVPGLRPDYVLVYVGSNDLYKDSDYEMDELVRPNHGWKERVHDSSVLYSVFRTIRSMREATVVHHLDHHHEDIDRWVWTTEPRCDDVHGLMAPRLEAYKTRLRALAGKIRGMGAVPIFVAQPRFMYRKRPDGVLEGSAEVEYFDDVEVNGVDMYEMMELMRVATLDVAREENGIGIDAAAGVDWVREDFYDSVHNTPAGAEKLGRYLHSQLASLP